MVCFTESRVAFVYDAYACIAFFSYGLHRQIFLKFYTSINYG